MWHYQRTVAVRGGGSAVIIVTNPSVMSTCQVPRIQCPVTGHYYVIASLDRASIGALRQRQTSAPDNCKQTVYQQQFGRSVKQTACIRLNTSSILICLLYVLITDYLLLYILQT